MGNLLHLGLKFHAKNIQNKYDMIKMGAKVDPSNYFSYEHEKSRNKRENAISNRQNIIDQMKTVTVNPHLYSKFDDHWLTNTKVRNTLGLQGVWDSLSKSNTLNQQDFDGQREENHFVPSLNLQKDEEVQEITYPATNKFKEGESMNITPPSTIQKTVLFEDQASLFPRVNFEK